MLDMGLEAEVKKCKQNNVEDKNEEQQENTIKAKSLQLDTSEYYKKMKPVYGNGGEWELLRNFR